MTDPPEPDSDPVLASTEVRERIQKLLDEMGRLQAETERLRRESEELRRIVKLPANGAD